MNISISKIISKNLSIRLGTRLKQNPFVKSLATKLTAGTDSVVLMVQGDSTGNDSTDWFVKTMEAIAPKYPAYSFYQRQFYDSTQTYDFIGNPIQVGTAGAGYALIPDGSAITSPHSADLAITGDIEISIKYACDDWTYTGRTQGLIQKMRAGGNRSYGLYLVPTGQLFFWWSADGTTLISAQSTAIPSVVDGSPIWLRVTLDVDNGASGNTTKFYTSANGFTWTQLGADVVKAGTTAIYSSNLATLQIGGSGYLGDFAPGKFYSAIIRNGISGAIVASPDAGIAFPSTLTTFKDCQGKVYTKTGTTSFAHGSPSVLLLNGCVAGKATAYSTDATRFAKQTPLEPHLAFIDYGHNEATDVGYKAIYEGLCNQLLAKYANVGIIGSTQNPQKTPRTELQIATHKSTQDQIIELMTEKEYGLIRVYYEMLPSVDTLVNVDGIHPEVPAGYEFWKNRALIALSGL